MNWSTPADLRAQVQKLWDRGRLLSVVLNAEPLFPLRLTLRGPNSSALSERFDDVRHWIAALRQHSDYRLEMQSLRHRILGTNLLPSEVWIDTREQALLWIGKRREADCFDSLVAQTRRAQPALLPWLARYPLKALQLAPDWPRLLAVIAWLQLHPRPGIYLRQIDLPGVHSKFIESQRAPLSELLDLALAPADIDYAATGAGQFCRRYGLRDKPQRVRLRMLDPESGFLPGGGDQDLTLDQGTFARLRAGGAQVFITENEINFLAFPPRRASMVIFGAGYGFEALASAAWLHDCDLHYWGDLDTHGFAILDQFRAHFPRAQSFLMDRATLMAHQAQWGQEPQPLSRDLPRLVAAEQQVYDELRDNRIQNALRLEQERIGFGWILAALEHCPSP